MAPAVPINVSMIPGRLAFTRCLRLRFPSWSEGILSSGYSAKADWLHEKASIKLVVTHENTMMKRPATPKPAYELDDI